MRGIVERGHELVRGSPPRTSCWSATPVVAISDVLASLVVVVVTVLAMVGIVGGAVCVLLATCAVVTRGIVSSMLERKRRP